MAIGSLQLLTNGSGTGQWMTWTGGRGQLTVNGTLVTGGLECMGSDGQTAIPVRDINGAVMSLAAGTSDIRIFEMAPCQIRYRASVGSGIYARVDPVPH